jgi:plastocyanin
MRATMKAVVISLLALGAFPGCGGSSSSSSSTLPSGFYITISNMTFTPSTLSVPPGATVTVLNSDATQHSVTSETTSGTYTPGAVSGISFDTGAFNGSASFTIPSSAASGTVVPFYCTVHRTTMSPPNGSIKIDPAAQPATPTGTGGGAGGY